MTRAAESDQVTDTKVRYRAELLPAGRLKPRETTMLIAQKTHLQSILVGTHHIGASTDQAQEAIAAETVRVIVAYKNTGKVPNVVNLAKRTPATHMLVVRHRDRPGVLAHVFNLLREANLNVQETENIVFEGAEAAVAYSRERRPAVLRAGKVSVTSAG